MSTLSQHLPHLANLTWATLADKPILGTGATVFAFLAAVRLSRVFGNPPLLNPTLLAILLIAIGIEATGVPYETYLRGSDPDYILKLAEYVDSKMRPVADAISAADSFRLAVLRFSRRDRHLARDETL